MVGANPIPTQSHVIGTDHNAWKAGVMREFGNRQICVEIMVPELAYSTFVTTNRIRCLLNTTVLFYKVATSANEFLAFGEHEMASKPR